MDYLKAIPFIINLHEYHISPTRQKLWMVFEYCKYKSIRDIITQCNTLPEEMVSYVLQSVLQSLSYLHKMNVIHLHIRASNILIDENGNVKLDHLALDSSKHHYVAKGSHWMSPEEVKSSQITDKTDVWKVGITAFEMLRGVPPHYELHPLRAILLVGKGPLNLQGLEQFSTDCQTFVKACLQHNYEQRPSVIALLQHPWINFTKSLKMENQFHSILEDAYNAYQKPYYKHQGESSSSDEEDSPISFQTPNN
eukprot:TRINITY_DN20971_c0_g1_i2.p1 TRINITY_DN20971_c0_g1~~TRINITY_DN20971_c0_g1_i2.p1  ORF type:complete len:252 (-),score=56.94 TRINITY_DN20971_c0_g1_i2:70-825(-)